jgi:DUF4097 and DUF4098 domain-containing protein YvlB
MILLTSGCKVLPTTSVKYLRSVDSTIVEEWKKYVDKDESFDTDQRKVRQLNYEVWKEWIDEL